MCRMDREAVANQLRRGTLEYCVLSLLAQREMYGFELVRTLSATDGMVTSEGTVYPLLSRLKRERHVSTTWRDSDAGPPRKYYAITDEGQAALAAFRVEWRRFRAAVDQLLREGASDARLDQSSVG
jgi:PadR family transcriptional regulator, regulatory protein PadR